MLTSAIVLNRFGLGARPGDTLPTDPKASLLSQFERFEARPQALASVPARREVVQQLSDYIAEQRMEGRAKRQMQPASMAMNEQQGDGLPNSAKRYLRRGIRDDYLVMAGARMSSALTTSASFVERLVHFWANHFAVSVDKLPVVRTGRACSRSRRSVRTCSAVSPTCCSRSSSIRQCSSISTRRNRSGPNSRAGQLIAARGSAEARAQRESGARDPGAAHARRAHRLQPGGRHRVRPCADRLDGRRACPRTGGSAARTAGRSASSRFAELLHEPGARHDHRPALRPGRRGSRRAPSCMDLASQSGDGAASLDQARAPFRRRRSAAGDGRAAERRRTSRAAATCRQLYRAIVDFAGGVVGRSRSSSRRRGNGRSRRCARSIRTSLEPTLAGALMNQLGQPTWRPGSPAGFDDIAASWAAPEALMRRVEVAQRFAARAGDRRSTRGRSRRESAARRRWAKPTRDRDRARRKPGRRRSRLLLVSPEFLRR